jgi:hypothetical protein
VIAAAKSCLTSWESRTTYTSDGIQSLYATIR